MEEIAYQEWVTWLSEDEFLFGLLQEKDWSAGVGQ